MSFEIKHKGGHYELYVNGRFNSSYDSFTEATDAIEEMREEE